MKAGHRTGTAGLVAGVAVALAILLGAAAPGGAALAAQGSEAPSLMDRIRLVLRMEGAERALAMLAQGGDDDARDFDARRLPRSDAAFDGGGRRHASLETWRGVNLEAAGARALRYLPEHARIQATVYPLSRPRGTTTVTGHDGEAPAVFMYVEPGRSPASVERELGRELHRIGLATACGVVDAGDATGALLEGFREGVAALAAAGGYDPDPHAVRDVVPPAVATDPGRAAAAMEAVEAGLESGRAPAGSLRDLGWMMAVTVERELGRATLVDGLCRPERLLLDYDTAAEAVAHRDPAGAPPRWSTLFLDRLRVRAGRI